MADRCASGKHCNGGNGEPAVTDSPLCGVCVQEVAKCLSDLPHLVRALRYFVGNKPKAPESAKISRSPTPQCPIDPHTLDLITETYEVVDRAGGWKANIPALILEPGVQYLLWVGGCQEYRFLDGARRALDIRRIHSRINNLVGLEKTRQRRHAPCPECGLSGVLWNWVGEEIVRCDGCPMLMELAAYDDHCAELLRKR